MRVQIHEVGFSDRLVTLCCAIALFLSIGCRTEPTTGKMPKKEAFENRDKAIGHVLTASSATLKPLQELSEKQRKAAVSLVLLANASAMYQTSGHKINPKLLAQLHSSFDQLSPDLQRVGSVGNLSFSCIDEAIAYASAMAQCRAEDPAADEADCPSAWGPSASLMNCTMKALEELHRELPDILGDFPPGPEPPPLP